MPGRILIVLCAALVTSPWACTSVSEPAFEDVAEPGLFDGVAIADLDEALTFARVEAGGRRRVIAVTEYRDGEVRGVDLSSALGRDTHDPILIFNERGYDGLRDLVRSAPLDAKVTAPAASLVIPVDLGDHHIAVATNFPEHAGDAGVEDGPFLFAKLVRPSGPYDPVPAGEGLLDYEVEVAWVTLAAIGPRRGPGATGALAHGGEPNFMGLILCNDFTDRDTLLGKIDPWNVESGAGFTTGKSFPGYLPLGNLFVVPRDHRRFAAGLELRLYVNDVLRQRSTAKEMIWDFDEIIAQSWARKEQRWDHRGRQVSLFGDSEVIPDRTLILSGTPHGTVFDGLRTRHYVSGLTTWLLGGWDEPIPEHVVSSYIDDARSAGVYLRADDRVEIHVDGMGVLRNQVVR